MDDGNNEDWENQEWRNKSKGVANISEARQRWLGHAERNTDEDV